MLRLRISRALLLSLICLGLSYTVRAQTATTGPALNSSAAAESAQRPAEPGGEIEEVRRQLREQREELEQMRATLVKQSQLIDELRQRVEQTTVPTSAQVKPDSVVATDRLPADSSSNVGGSGQNQQQTNDRLGRIEEQTKKNTEAIAKQLGSITFSGDIRLRYETIFGQLSTLPNSANPSVLGNELSARNRFRLRARLSMRGQIGREFDWGLRFATGSFADTTSSNQTLTDFYNRKPFGLDNAFIAWTPRRLPGIRIQGGKFDVPWLRTEMTIDNDLTVEGFNELYSRDFKGSTLKNLTFVVWQLPFLERNSAFVRNSNGTVNVDESRRAGRDLALYGGQVRARFEPTSVVGLTLSLADLYFSGTQFITPIQFFGGQLQLPVTVQIPATATTPAQTVTAQVSIPRDLLVAGNANLGVSTASTNATNRDGRLASGYNLLDILARLDLTHSKRFPVALIFDFVNNTQTHDISVAGPGGTTLFMNNDENRGYWAELQVGKARERGDLGFGYTFVRIEKDAVLTPFNFSDIAQQSDIRAHRFIFNYTVDPRIVLTMTTIITERPNGLLGAFGTTPPGSLNPPTTRLQFDTVFRF